MNAVTTKAPVSKTTPCLWLSKLILNPFSEEVQIALADGYEMHKAIWLGFQGSGPRPEKRPFIYRVEQYDMSVGVIVQSTAEPVWSRLPIGFLDRPVEAKNFTPSISNGEKLIFRLVGSPTKHDRIDGVDKRRVPLRTDEDRIAWLTRKLEACGAKLLDTRLNVRPYLTGKRGKDRLIWARTQFDGVLEVVDANKLHASLANGIGPSRAFGFGLLSLAR